MIYVASPYSSPILQVPEQRFRATAQFVLHLLQEGAGPVFSPIVYFHPLATQAALPTDAGYWHNTNMQFLRRAEVVFLLRLTGWEQSKGVAIELNVAKMLGIPVRHFSPDFRELS